MHTDMCPRDLAEANVEVYSDFFAKAQASAKAAGLDTSPEVEGFAAQLAKAEKTLETRPR